MFVRIGLVAAVAVGALACGIAQAQTTNGTASQAGSTAAPAKGTDEIIVTAQKREERLQDTPLTITALNGASLANRNIVKLADLQTQTPNLAFATPSNGVLGSFVTIRAQGVGDQLIGNQPSVGVYVDNVYMASGNGLQLGDLADVERVEVLKGPQGTLYGRNTTGGSINIITKLPTDKFEASLKVGLGSRSRDAIQGVLNVPLASNLDARFVVQQSRVRGYGYDYSKNVPVGGLSTIALRGTVLWQPTDRFTVTLRGDYSHGRSTGSISHVEGVTPVSSPLDAGAGASIDAAFAYGLAGSFADLTPQVLAEARSRLLSGYPTSVYGTESSADIPRNQERMRAYGGSVELKYDLTDDISLKSLTAARSIRRFSIEDSDGLSADILDVNPQITPQHWITEELQLGGTAFDKRLDWVTGFYFFHTKGTDFLYVDALPLINPLNPAITDGDITDTSYSGYAQGTFHVTSKLDITGGVRRTQEKNTLISRNRDAGGCEVPAALIVNGVCSAKFPNKFGAWSYTGGAAYHFTRDIMLYVNNSRGFKAGGQNQRGTAADVGSYDPYGPEKATQTEAGLKTQLFDRRVTFNIAGFTTKYKDLQRIVVVPSASSGVTSLTQNAASARVEGIEADISVHPTQELEIHGAMGYIHTKYLKYVDATGDRSGEKFPNTPAWNYSLGGSYTQPTGFGSIRGGLDWYWQSRVDFQPGNDTAYSLANGIGIQKAYGVLSGRLSANIDRLGIEIALWGRNLTDKKYKIGDQNYTGSLGVAWAAYAEPRSVGVELSKKF